MGAALAFYTLFSLAPLMLIAIAIAGTIFGRDEAQSLILAQMASIVGRKAAEGVVTLLQAVSGRNYAVLPALIGTATLVFGAMTVFNELKTDLDRVWRCHATRRKGFIALVCNRLLSFAMVIAVGVLILASLLASAFISATGAAFFDQSEGQVHATEFAISFVVMTGLFAFIYKLLPSTRIAWGDVWMGAAVTSVLFWIGKLAISLYIGHAAIASISGAAGTLIVLILWVYYSAQVFFLGAEFTREFAHRHGSKQNEPDPHLIPVGLEAANEAEMVERARKLVKGEDPVLLRIRPH